MTVATMELGWQAAELCTSSIKTTSAKEPHAWSEDPQKILSLMMGKPVDSSGPLPPAIRPCQSSETVHLDHEKEPPLPTGWEKRLDLKSGSITFVNCSTGLSTIDDPRLLQSGSLNRSSSLCLDLLQSNSSRATSVKAHHAKNNSPTSTLEEHLDLELNLGCKPASPRNLAAVSSSSKLAAEGTNLDHKRTSSCDDCSSSGIIVTGCKSCLMYVMLSPKNPQCPRCGSYVVLDNQAAPKKIKA
ncbi:uncharacterized protein LOC9662612 [Selaginella moellendorffii]|nr:uncharacterized protein LOC9662612 [Selaginella moellendorffii]|eukprot:XP_002990651.2 uncharacterized protein LOC9662612 [Selaginella moellendorffii]